MLSTAFRCSLAFFFALGVVSAAQPTFYARQDVVLYIDSQQAQGLLVIADVNGDGILDLIGSPMLLGNGDGTFRTGPDLDIPDPELGAPVAFDTNGDGKVDLVYVSYQQSRLAVGVMLGNGDGTFEAPVYYLSTVNDGTTGPAGDALVSGDFNGDGITDVAVLGTAEIVVFMGSGTGAFVAGTPIQLTYNKIEDSIGLAAADMNRDGHLDLVVDANGALQVLLGNGNGTFQPAIVTNMSRNAGNGAFAVGDLNQDGFPDVAILNNESYSVALYEGIGNGKFRSPSTIQVAGDAPFQALAIADVNGDGIPDLVTDLVQVALGTGHGAFAPAIYYPVNGGGLAAGGGGLGIADLRSTGKLDLITQDGGNGISIILNTGKGVYEDGVTTTTPGDYIACSASGDFNRDGIPDLAISTGLAIEIYLGSGKAGAPFTAGATYSVPEAGCPVAGDLNGDGFPDLLVPSGLDGAPGVVIGFLGKGDGTFAQGPSSNIPSLNNFFVLADFNGDGKLDYATNANLLAFGNGDGSFGTPAPFSTEGTLINLATADMNGDGKPDIVAIEGFGSVLYILLNNGNGTFTETSQASCDAPAFLALGDLNGDGKPDIAVSCENEVGVYINNGTGGLKRFVALGEADTPAFGNWIVIADVNGDGIPDIACEEYANVAVFLGQGSTTFAAPFYIGTGNAAAGLYALNTHKQKARSGIQDLVEVDASGVIYDLLNLTK